MESADDGTLTGIENVDTPEGRDRLCQRIEGVCSGNVRPAITPVVKFAREGNAIDLMRLGGPCAREMPHIRGVPVVVDWLTPTRDFYCQHSSEFLSTVAPILIDVLIYGSEIEERNVNPWLDLVRTQLGSAGAELRRIATEDTAVQQGIDKRLRALADKLDVVATHRLTLGGDSWRTLTQCLADAVKEAARIKADCIDAIPVSADSRKHVKDLVLRSARELEDLDARAEAMAERGRIEELQEEASRIGWSLLVVSHYQFDEPGGTLAAELQGIGRQLHLLETERLYMDGGQSMQRIVKRVHDLNSRLQQSLSTNQFDHYPQ